MTATNGGPLLDGPNATAPAELAARADVDGAGRQRAPRPRTVLGLARVEASLLVRSVLVLAGLLAAGVLIWVLIHTSEPLWWNAAWQIGFGQLDGVFFVDLLGMSPRPMAADDALRLLLRALGGAEHQVPRDPDGRASVYRSLLRDRRVLVVLDNAGSEEQVRPLLPGEGTGLTLITAKRLLAGLEGVRRLALKPLALPEAIELLTGILGDRAAADGEPALTRLAELCEGMPLALRIVGNRLVSRPGWDATDLAVRLADTERHLDQFTAGDLNVASAFEVSYEQLSEPARRMFRRLAEVAGRDFDASLAAVAGGISARDAWDALDELVDLGLLEDGTAGRFRFHDLVRRFARERLDEESQAERQALTARVTSWLLRMATLAGQWFEPGFGRQARPDSDLAVLSSAADAEQWLRADVDNWMGAVRSASASGQHGLVLDCVESVRWFTDRWPQAPHWHELFTLGTKAAAAIGDPRRVRR